jgi:uncharacterized protein YndB with AHSA1/START domain
VLYKDIVEPERITYTDYFTDSDGNINENMPSTDINMEFIDVEGKTKLINRAEYVSAEALKMVMDMGMLQGINETWNRLEDHLNKIK